MARQALNIKVSVEYKKLQEESRRNQEKNRSQNFESRKIEKETKKQKDKIAPVNQESTSAQTSTDVIGMTDTTATGATGKGRSPSANFLQGRFLKDEPPSSVSNPEQSIGLTWFSRTYWSRWTPTEPYAGVAPGNFSLFGGALWSVQTGNYVVNYACGDGSQKVEYSVNTIDVPEMYPVEFNNVLEPSYTKSYYASDDFLLTTRNVYVGDFTFRDYDWWGTTGGFVIPAGNGAAIIVSIDLLNLCYLDTTIKTVYATYYDHNSGYTTHFPYNSPLGNNGGSPVVYGFNEDQWDPDSSYFPPTGSGWILNYERIPIEVSKKVRYYLVTNTSIREIFPPSNSYITSYALGWMVEDFSFTGYRYLSPNYLDFPVEFSPYYDQYWYGELNGISELGWSSSASFFDPDVSDPSIFEYLFNEAIYYGSPAFCEESDLIKTDGLGYDVVKVRWLASDQYTGLYEFAQEYHTPDEFYLSNENIYFRSAKKAKDTMNNELLEGQEAFYAVSTPSNKNTVIKQGINKVTMEGASSGWNNQNYGYMAFTLYHDWANPAYCKKMCLKLGFSEADLIPIPTSEE